MADAGLLRQALDEAGIDVQLVVVRDGDKAMKLLRPTANHSAALRPDLILLDLNMPSGGKQTLQELKDDPQLREIPVIVLSHSAADEDVLDCYRRYANCYLTKPLELDDFVVMLRSAGQFWLEWATLPRRHG